MEIEDLITMNDGIYLSILMMVKVIVQIATFIAIVSFAVYLAGIAWLCFKEMRQPTRSQMKSVPEPPEPDEYDLLAALAALDVDLGESLTAGVPRREQALQRISIE